MGKSEFKAGVISAIVTTVILAIVVVPIFYFGNLGILVLLLAFAFAMISSIIYGCIIGRIQLSDLKKERKKNGLK